MKYCLTLHFHRWFGVAYKAAELKSLDHLFDDGEDVETTSMQHQIECTVLIRVC